MKLFTRVTALALTLALCVSPALAAGVEDKFPAIKEYPGYTDVPAGAWFEAGAKLCYEVGLMNGTPSGFQPERNMTAGEATVIAARILEAVTGEAIVYYEPKPGETLPWYFSQVEYLKRHGVTLPENMEANATRAGFVGLLSAVLPDELLKPINTITTLPDSDREDVLRLYRAGILTGTDKYGTFAGDKPLTRQEGAAMVSRVVREGLRTGGFVPADYRPFTAAECRPGDVFFTNGVTAERYLDTVNALITEAELSFRRQGAEFNWFSKYVAEYDHVLAFVKGEALVRLGVARETGTQLYKDFDVQVYYSRLVDLLGGPLGQDSAVTTG